jgi:hypothetical protein
LQQACGFFFRIIGFLYAGHRGILYVYYSTNIWATLVLMMTLPKQFIQKKTPTVVGAFCITK